jgi:hypothetical protein
LATRAWPHGAQPSNAQPSNAQPSNTVVSRTTVAWRERRGPGGCRGPTGQPRRLPVRTPQSSAPTASPSRVGGEAFAGDQQVRRQGFDRPWQWREQRENREKTKKVGPLTRQEPKAPPWGRLWGRPTRFPIEGRVTASSAALDEKQPACQWLCGLGEPRGFTSAAGRAVR